MSAKGTLGFIAGTIFGVAAGVTVGILCAPRSGKESSALAQDAMQDVWDCARDTYERNQDAVSSKINAMRPTIDATTDELRAKVDRARERMESLRNSLSEAVANSQVAVKTTTIEDENGAHIEVVEACPEV